jgi:mannose-6-phosphate isomerase
MSFSKYEPTRFEDDILGKCEYFTAKRYTVRGVCEFFADEDSFNSIVCTKGEGEIDGIKLSAGDSFFIPAGYGKYNILGDCEIILTYV